jgi:iron complex outermembrane receptor protein
MQLSRSRTWLLSCTALAGALSLGAPVHAAAAAEPGATAKVEEIVVTGALRSLRLQEAPVAVTAVKPEEFINAGLKEPRDLQFLSPSIQVSIQGANAIYIRGSGTNSQNGGTEQSVGMVLDGVLQGFVDDIGADISDLDHVEVYRGPQGTQFAKNASAGVVSVMTKNPQFGILSGLVHASYGEHSDTSDDATVNVPINDKLAARLSFGFQHRDGVFYNAGIRQDQGGREQKSFRAKLRFEPKERWSFILDVDGRLTFDKPNFPQAWAFCGPATTTAFTNYTGTRTLPGCNGALLSGITPSNSNSTIAERDDAYRHTQASGVGLTSSIPLGEFTLTSITAYRAMSREFFGPAGSGAYTNTYLHNWYNGGQASEELRLISPADKRFTYVGGLYFYDRDTVTKSCGCGPGYQQAQVQYPNTPSGAGVWYSPQGGQTKAHNVTKSYAAYTDGSFHVTSKLQINAGARITYDDVYASIATVATPGVYNQPGSIPGGVVVVPGFINGVFYNAGATGNFVIPATVNTAGNPAVVVLPFRSLSNNHTGYTYRIGPQYFITPDIQVYGTFAHGYKGPLIDTTVNTLDAILPEEVDMYEAGLKSAWLDHRLTANLTVFREQFKNYQVSVLNQTITPNQFQLGNAGGELSQGVELELNARPHPDWNLSASTTFNDSHYTDFVTSCWNAAEPIKQTTSGINGCYVHPGATAAATNAVGTPLINNSRWTYRVGATYTHTIDGYKVDMTANYLWRSQWLSAPMDPNIVNPGYGVLGLNGGVTTPDGRYRIGFFARNALDTFFYAGRQANNGGWTNVLNPESVRTVGVNFTGRFE